MFDKKHHGIIIAGLCILVVLSGVILYYVVKIEKSTVKESFMLSDSSCKVGYDGTLLPSCETGSDMDRMKCYETCINLQTREGAMGDCRTMLSSNSNIMARYNMYGQKVHGDGWIQVEAMPCAQTASPNYDY